MRLKIFGIGFNLSFSFFFIAALTLLADKTGTAGLVLVSSALHEFGHLLAIRILGMDILNISVKLYGLEIKRRYSTSVSYRDETIIAASGPVINIIASIIFRFSSLEFLQIYSAVNLVIGMFNLIPILPLDGGQIIINTLAKNYGEETARKISFIMSIAILTPLYTAAIVLCINYSNFSLIITCTYLTLNLLFLKEK